MTSATEDRVSAGLQKRRPSFTAIAVAGAAIGVLWPGGRVPAADFLFTLAVFWLIYIAVARRPGFKELFSAAPVAAKWGAKVVLSALLLGQLWGVSADTYPVATWTMYSHNPGPEAVVYRFDAVTVDGEPVAFTPSASNRTLPAKMALVHLRRLSRIVYESSIALDADQHAADQESLRRAIVAYVELHNAKSPDAQPVIVEVSRVAYDVTQRPVSIESGERTVLLYIDFETA